MFKKSFKRKSESARVRRKTKTSKRNQQTKQNQKDVQPTNVSEATRPPAQPGRSNQTTRTKRSRRLSRSKTTESFKQKKIKKEKNESKQPRKRKRKPPAKKDAKPSSTKQNNNKRNNNKKTSSKKNGAKTRAERPCTNVFDDDVTNEQLQKIIETHYQTLLCGERVCQELREQMAELQNEHDELSGFHTIHKKRGIVAKIKDLQEQLVKSELDTDAREFRQEAQDLFDKISLLQKSDTMGIMEGLPQLIAEEAVEPQVLVQAETSETSTGDEPGPVGDVAAPKPVGDVAAPKPVGDVAAPKPVGDVAAPKPPRRRQVAMTAMRTISFGTDMDDDKEPPRFRELLLDDLRMLICPSYVRPAYRVSEEECSRCRGSVSLVAGQNILVCDNPACRHEQRSNNAHVGFGNRDHMSLSNCRYKKLVQFAKMIKKKAVRLDLKGVATPAQFFDVKKFVKTHRRQRPESETEQEVTADQTKEALQKLGYWSKLKQNTQAITDCLNFVQEENYTPDQVLIMMELFLVGEKVYEDMQRKNNVNGRVNTLNYNLRGMLINSMTTFGDKYKKRFKKLKDKINAASQQQLFKKMMESEDIEYKPITV
jgi:hypothetical protein